jgi:ELP3 family radical SAM enzyme/protein acetyltransferase
MNIEDLYNNNVPENTIKIINDLLTKTYSCIKDIDDEVLLLKRKYKCMANKRQMAQIYNKINQDKQHNNDDLFKRYFKVKETRSTSGVMVISVITSPYPEYLDENGVTKVQRFSCKHDCAYCPRELDDNGKEKNARSYLSDEPTVARGLELNYDAYQQFTVRANQYYRNSHPVDKIELIVLGGTWTEYPRQYQETFIRDLFYAANTFYEKREERYSLVKEQNINETAKVKIIGLTLEMRPDSITDEECYWLRNLGCTRVQLGIQHTDDEILKKVNRGCYLKDSINALKTLKDYCFKVDAHWMPDLPGSSFDKDKKMFDYILNSQDLQFDDWKIYPTAVVPWTRIKKWHDEGSYKSWVEENPEKLIQLLMYVKRLVPEWIRLNRIVRDIPNTDRDGNLYIHGGNKVTNLRQVVHNRLEKEGGEKCKCIRCREVKSRNLKNFNIDKMVIITRKYYSSEGEEYFISMESGEHECSYLNNNTWFYNGKKENGIIYGFIRLRLSKNAGGNGKYFPNLVNSAFIRELHVYGEVISTSDVNHKTSFQHKGIGKKLLQYAENKASNMGYQKIAVISGVGVKRYYEKMGYFEVDKYMMKPLMRSDLFIYIYISIILIIHVIISCFYK